MKKIIYFLLLVVLFIPIIVNGDDLVDNKKGSFNVIYKYGENLVSDAEVNVYKIGFVNDDKTFSFIDDIKLDDNLDVSTTSELIDLSKKISKYVSDNGIDTSGSCDTNKNGRCKLNDLEQGIYLIEVESVVKDNYEYFSSPTLVAIPTYNEEENKQIFDVDVVMKTESKKLNDINPSNDNSSSILEPTDTSLQSSGKASVNKSSSVQTVDTIIKYLIIFGLSILIIILLVAFFMNQRKKDKNNEDVK